MLRWCTAAVLYGRLGKIVSEGYMRRTGTVMQTQGDSLKVCFSRLEACDSCNMCGSGRDDTMVTIKGTAQVGDIVEVDMPDAQVLKVSLLTYLVPLLGLLLGLWLGTLVFAGREIFVLLSGLGMLALALVALKMMDNKLGLKTHWQPRLIAVLPAEDAQEAHQAG